MITNMGIFLFQRANDNIWRLKIHRTLRGFNNVIWEEIENS